MLFKGALWMNIWDMLLLPKKMYEKLTDRKSTLYIGFILVGIVDLCTFFINDFAGLFTGKSANILFYNITLALLMIVLMGFVDVLFFTVPLFDLFKLFKRENRDTSGKTLTKVMKAYILANIIVLPINLIIYMIFKCFPNLVTSLNSGYSILFFAFMLDLLISIWFSGIIARGINTIYKFDVRLKSAVFMTIFTWSYILAEVFGFIIENWFMPLFR